MSVTRFLVSRVVPPSSTGAEGSVGWSVGVASDVEDAVLCPLDVASGVPPVPVVPLSVAPPVPLDEVVAGAESVVED